ncbi:alpha/beta hydrolase fold domain-containing protein [Microtetraspora sp. NBRC 16547]|uniref:alpha/beta hydrolase family protein n=1 Tax=Microtetraspora sp. NBRC 16547 TaxID=3030993 RepID=UPI0025570BF8|nr:alpha/beta hydrolase fold domain-containing protein [Microtetraspora sp. NBRC 16547]
MSDEYVPHAVAAVRLLQAQPAVDPGRVFVVGHSMGGKVAHHVDAADVAEWSASRGGPAAGAAPGARRLEASPPLPRV